MDWHAPITPETLSGIVKIIKERSTEEHPLRSQSKGLKEFARLTKLIPRLDRAALEGLLPPLEQMLQEQRTAVDQRECVSCYAKLCIFIELFCREGWPQKAAEYAELYEKHCRYWKPDRNYRQDVQEAIDEEE